MTFKTTIRLGIEEVPVETSDFEEYMTILSVLHEMQDRVTKDARFRVRPGDDGNFLEMFSPSLRAAKKVSQHKSKTALSEQFPYNIFWSTPWVAFYRGQMYYGYDNISKDLFDAGFVRGKFVPVEKDGTIADNVTEDQMFDIKPNWWREVPQE